MQSLGLVTLDVLLQMFVSQEFVEDTSSRSKENFVKQLTFGRLPDCLCFHIQRTGEQRRRCIFFFVNFPLESLSALFNFDV